MSTEAETRALRDAIDRDAFDQNGEKIGKVVDLYTDEETGRPEWLAITSGIFGKKVSFAPITGASFRGEEIVLPFDKSHVKDAPKIDADGDLSEDEESALYAHYGMGYSKARSDSGLPGDRGAAEGRNRNTGTDRPSRVAGATDDSMTRSEEELSVDKQRHETGRARLRKSVETEHVQLTVPVQREVAKVVTEPITDKNRDRALDGPDITENEHEIVLSEEEIDVQKKVVPKERVRLESETVTEQKPVEADVRKEQIRTEGDIDESRSKRR